MVRIITLAIVVTLLSPFASPLTSTDVPDDEWDVRGATTRQRDIIVWAVQRFTDAGLELEPSTVEVWPTQDGCGGNNGLFVRSDGGNRIELCNVSRPIVLHELGHAWVETHADDGIKEDFLSLLGLSTWASDDAPWLERGAEQAAIAMSFGLAERPLDAYEASLHTDMLAAYEILTGQPSPRLVSDR